MATIPATATTLPTATTSAPAATPLSTTDALAPTPNPVDRGIAMLAAINKVRSEQRCPALRFETRLIAAAQAHADDIAPRHIVAHVGSDGATLDERLRRFGYPFARRAEILGYGTLDGMLAAWLDEDVDGPHRVAITTCEYTEAGVGWTIDPRGIEVWVVDMANRGNGGF